MIKNEKQNKNHTVDFFVNKKYTNGFVLLFSVVLTGIILAVTLGVTNFTLKELNFSTLTRDTNEAFFAADIGIECALYYDLVGTQSSDPNLGWVNPFGEPANTVSTYCAGTAVDLSVGSGTQADPWIFYIHSLGESGKACAIVEVYKETNPDNTYIFSDGYNIGGATSPDCTSTSTRRVERRLEVSY